MPGWVWYAIGFVIVVTIVTVLSVVADRWYAKRIGRDRARRADLQDRAARKQQAQGHRRGPGQPREGPGPTNR